MSKLKIKIIIDTNAELMAQKVTHLNHQAVHKSLFTNGILFQIIFKIHMKYTGCEHTYDLKNICS